MYSQSRLHRCGVWPWVVMAARFATICNIALADQCSGAGNIHTCLRWFYDLLSFSWRGLPDIASRIELRQEGLWCSLFAAWWRVVSLAHSFICCAQVSPASRYIRPGRAYSLLTVEDCLALGSHFYTFLHLQATLNSLVNEHYAGRLFIQIPRPLAPRVLGEMMKVIYEWYEFHSNENSLGENSALSTTVLCSD